MVCSSHLLRTSTNVMTSSSLNQIPPELFGDLNTFTEALSLEMWESCLSGSKRNDLLNKFLPKSMSKAEKQDTVRLLLNNELHRFGENPLSSVFMHLKLQRLAPDIAKTLEDVRTLKQKAKRLKEEELQIEIWNDVMRKRKCLFKESICLSPGEPFKTRGKLQQQRSVLSWEPSNSLVPKSEKARIRRFTSVQSRYRKELSDLNELPQHNVSSESEDGFIDMFGSGSENGHVSLPRKFSAFSSVKSSKAFSSPSSSCVSQLSEEKYSRLLKSYKRKKRAIDSKQEPADPLMDTRHITLNDIINRVTCSPEKEFCKTQQPAGGVNRANNAAIRTISANSSKKAVATKRKASANHASMKKPLQPPQPPKSSSSPLLPATVISAISPATIVVKPEIVVEEKLENINVIDRSEKISISIHQDANTTTKTRIIEHAAFPPTIEIKDVSIFDFDDQLDEISVEPLSLPSTSIVVTTTTASGTSIVTSLPSLVFSDNVISHTNSTNKVLATVNSSSGSKPLQQPVPAQGLVDLVPEPSQAPQKTVAQSGAAPQIETPPTSFFCLLRDTFRVNAAHDHKLTLHRLEELIKEKVRCFDAKLCWSHEMVQSAMNYLSGVLPPPDMVPLVDYKEKNQQWQWIGRDRDSDAVLVELCREWTSEKDRNASTSLMDPSQPVPPAICPTEWLVKPSSDEERKCYRDQEAIRYTNPHKAFTFKIHSYQSVVGPVKGCGIGGTSATVQSASPNKAREHSLLVSDRPPFVTLLSLVRDAAARLPNGEGTRADICELLKDSQYLLPSVSDQQVNGIVSGALDRLHYEKDPCVKYDVNRKVWIYLHRNRTEHEFERLHEMQVAAAKAKRTLTKTQRKSTVPRTPTSANSTSATANGKLLVTQKAPKASPTTVISNNVSAASSTTENCSSVSVTTIPAPLIPPTPQQPVVNAVEQTTPIRRTIAQTSLIVNSLSTASAGSITTITPTVDKSSIKPVISSSIQTSLISDGSQINKQTFVASQNLAALLAKKAPVKTVKYIKREETAPGLIAVSSIEISPTITSSFATSRPIVSMPAVALTPSSMTPNEPLTAVNNRVLPSSLIVREKIVKHATAKLSQQQQLKPSVTVLSQKPTQVQLVASGSEHKVVQQYVASSSNIIHQSHFTNNSGKVALEKQQISHVAKHIQLPISQTNTIATSSVGATHQISIPSNIQFFGGRPTSVVLATPAGKSYMMAATTGGSYVLQPQNPSAVGTTITTTATSMLQAQGTPLAMRTLQGIKVIPVPNNNSRSTTGGVAIQAQPHHQGGGHSVPTQLVARIISNRGGVGQPTQIVIPTSSGYQPVLVQQTMGQQANNNQTLTPSMIQNSPIAISVQPHKVVPAQQQVTTVSLPLQNHQKR